MEPRFLRLPVSISSTSGQHEGIVENQQRNVTSQKTRILSDRAVRTTHLAQMLMPFKFQNSAIVPLTV